MLGLALLIGLVGFFVYFQQRTPPGVTPMGDGAETVAWIGLATGIVALLTAITGLIQKIIELRSKE